MNNKNIILSANHVNLTDGLKEMVYGKVERLLRHEDGIIRIHVELEHSHHKSREGEYIAKGHIEIQGSPMVVSCATDDLGKSIDEMVDKLDRKIRRRGRLDRVKRKALHEIEIPAHLPKIAEA